MTVWSKAVIGVAVGLGLIVLLSIAVTVVDAVNNTHRVDAPILEREIRSELPMGSSLPTVEGSLRRHDLKFSFDARSKTIYAAAHKIKGSNVLTTKDLMFKFHFDDSMRLTSIDAQILYTGP